MGLWHNKEYNVGTNGADGHAASIFREENRYPEEHKMSMIMVASFLGQSANDVE